MADRYSQAVPMDYAYANGQGPVDENSPFITAARSSSQQSIFRNSNTNTKGQRGDVPLSFLTQADADYMKATGKRPFSSFDSPTKSSQSAFPSLRPAAGQTVLFADLPREEKPLPPRPDHFSTPRKLEIDFSSGGETPDTVDNAADNEATPDTSNMGFKKRINSFFGSASKSSPSKKELVLVKGSPGRGEIVKPYSHKVEKRVLKKRSRPQDKRRRLQHDQDESESETGAERQNHKAPGTNKDMQNSHGPGPIASLFSFIDQHPHLPHVLSFYAQLALNLFLVFGVIYILYSFWSTIRSDVDEKSREAISGLMAEMAVCAKHYQENRCDPTTYNVPPALENVCQTWRECMNKDPTKVGRAKVSAHTFAEIFNSFIEPISYKAMIFSLTFVFGCIALSNLAFGFFRNKALHQDPYMQMPPPPTPQRHPSGGWEQYGYTPYGHHAPLPPPNWGHPGLEPAPSGSQGSPSKQLEFH